MFKVIKLACEANRSVLVMGDFNYPDINWNTLKADSNGYKFLKLVMDCYLEQHVSVPTRDNNILDLILTNEMSVKDGIHMLAPVDNSDHIYVRKLISLKHCVRSQITRLKLQKSFCDLEHGASL